MTTTMPRDTTCALCGTRFEVFEVMSTNRFGAPDLDLRPPPMQRNTLEHQIARCPNCGYAGIDVESARPGDAEIVASAAYRSLLESDQPELAKSFACAAALHTEHGDLEVAGMLLLRAAWACDDDGDSEHAVELRTDCAGLLGEVLDSSATKETNEVLGLTLVLVDVLRRARRFDTAKERCWHVLSHPEPNTYADIAHYQAQLIEARDDACHRLDEIAEGSH